MHRCSRLKQASVRPATTYKLSNQSKLMTQPAYANEPSPITPTSGASEATTPERQTSQDASSAEHSTYTQDEKWALLSAYMDNECSYKEQQLVEHWLASDVKMQQQYQAQLKLRLAIKTFL